MLALAALQIWKRPLPEVPKELNMNPIGASTTWDWEGHDNSWINASNGFISSLLEAIEK